MANRYFSEFPEKKLPTGKKKVNSPTRGSSGGGKGSGGEKTANWPTPTPSPGVGFNRRTNWPVVKTRAKKAGID